MSEQILRTLTENITKADEHFVSELSSIRANRAHPSLVENIKVDAYEGAAPLSLNALATITAPEADTILIQVWDQTVVKAIEKAVNTNNTGLQAIVDGTTVRIKMPPLSADRREELAKLTRKKGEEAQIVLRNARHDALNSLKNADLPEDQESRAKKLVEEQVKEASASVSAATKQKESEILTL